MGWTEVERAHKIATTPQTEEMPLAPNAPEYLDKLLSNALVLVDNGDYKSAINLLHNILKREARHIDAIEWLGYCYRQTNDLESALKCFTELSRLAPDENSFVHMADLMYELGNIKEAEIYYRSALGMINYESAHLFGIYKNLGNISVATGDYESAEEFYNKAFTLCPHSDILFVNFGTLEIQRGDMEGALERFRKAIDLNQQNDKAWVGLSMIHKQKGDAELAWANLARALDSNPTNLTALKLFVMWGFESQKYEEVSERLMDYMEQNSNNAEVCSWLAETLFRSGNLSAAHIEVVRASALAPDDLRIAQLEGMIAFECQKAGL